MSTRIIGLGNSILTDDGAGIYAGREIGRRLAEAGNAGSVDIIESEVGGFALMELMAGWDTIILLDSIQFDNLQPGTVVRIEPESLHTSLRIRSVHDIDLPTVVALGRKLGLRMPARLAIFGIQAEDPFTFGESPSEAARRGIREAADLVVKALIEGSADSGEGGD